MLVKAPGLVVVLLVALAACGRGDAEIRRARLDSEWRGLAAELDHLEDRFVADQARVRFWKEMRARHEQVAAVACASLDAHAEDMARVSVENARESARRPRLARAADAVLTSGRN